MVDTHALSVAPGLKQAGRLMRLASMASISVAVVLVAAKGTAWLVTDSVAMLSSLIDSALDLVSSLITFLAIRQALIPADEGHRFGHGKAEALAGMAQAGFIAASAGGLVLTVIDRFLHPHAVQEEFTGVAVSLRMQGGLSHCASSAALAPSTASAANANRTVAPMRMRPSRESA